MPEYPLNQQSQFLIYCLESYQSSEQRSAIGKYIQTNHPNIYYPAYIRALHDIGELNSVNQALTLWRIKLSLIDVKPYDTSVTDQLKKLYTEYQEIFAKSPKPSIIESEVTALIHEYAYWVCVLIMGSRLQNSMYWGSLKILLQIMQNPGSSISINIRISEKLKSYHIDLNQIVIIICQVLRFDLDERKQIISEHVYMQPRFLPS
jgi:hypothetical protein